MIGKIAQRVALAAAVAALVPSGGAARAAGADPVAATVAAFMTPRDVPVPSAGTEVVLADCPNGQCRLPGFGARGVAQVAGQAAGACATCDAQTVAAPGAGTTGGSVGRSGGFRPVRNFLAHVAERRHQRQAARSGGGCGCR